VVLGVPELEIIRIMGEAHDAGIKLEIHQGLPIWEFLPSPLHTIEAKRIDGSVRRTGSSQSCGCLSFQDMAIRFPDGSVRRPDIAIYCVAPDPTQEATTSIPLAIVEVLSPGSEVKDLQLSPPFFLSHGVQDVMVFDPQTRKVDHFRKDGRQQLRSPSDIELQCGCTVTV
jgi:Uma2 family endonuclease